MDFRHLSEVDLKLHLLGGDTIELDAIPLKPYTIREIKAFGYENYMRNLNWLTLSVDDFIKSTDDIERRIELQAQRSNLKTFDFYVAGRGQVAEMFMDAIAMVFRTGDIQILDEGLIAINFKEMGISIENEHGELVIDEEWLGMLPPEKVMLLHRDNYDDFVRVLKFQNFLDSVKGASELNPANEEARKLAEQMEINRKKVEAKKKAQLRNEKGDEGEIDISDIISAVTAKSNSINKFNVWDLTLYQLYDEYARLELIDNYEVNVQAMMTGAKDIDLRHWSSRV